MTTAEDFLATKQPTIRDLDIDAFADGVLAHRNGVAFHDNPHRNATHFKALCWRIGWNERALKALPPSIGGPQSRGPLGID